MLGISGCYVNGGLVCVGSMSDGARGDDESAMGKKDSSC